MEIGVNTYGIAKFLKEDFTGTLHQLSEASFTVLEPMVLFGTKEGGMAERLVAYSSSKLDMAGGTWPVSVAREKFRAARAAGFTIRSAHMAGPGYKKEYLDQAIAFAKEQDLKYYVISPMESSVTEMAKEVATLRYAARKFKENGITLLLHNHEAEWTDCEGECVFDFLLDTVPDMDVELDLGWTKFAGRDCVEVMRKYRDRIRILHFKDVREGADARTRSTCFTAIGQGSIPLADIMKEAEHMDLDEAGYVIDQDASLGSMMEDLRIGAANIAEGGKYMTPEDPGYQGRLPLSLMTFPMIRDRMHRKLNIEELCTLVETAGLDSMDMMEQEVKLYGVKETQRALEEHGLHLECLITSISMTRGRDHAIKKGIHNALVMAQQLNCSMLMIIPFPQAEVKLPGLPNRQEMVANAIKYLRLAVIAGKKYGVKICIEDTPSCQLPLSGIEECREILQAVPGLGLVYDTANMIPAGDDPIEFYEELKEYICHVHLKDVRRTSEKCLDVCRDGSYIKCCLWGEGIVPIKEIAKMLERDGYRGSCGIEYVTPEKEGLFPNMHQLEKFVSYIERS